MKLRELLSLLKDELITIENTKGETYKDKNGEPLEALCILDFSKIKSLRKFLNYNIICIESLSGSTFGGSTMLIRITSNPNKKGGK